MHFQIQMYNLNLFLIHEFVCSFNSKINRKKLPIITIYGMCAMKMVLYIDLSC